MKESDLPSIDNILSFNYFSVKLVEGNIVSCVSDSLERASEITDRAQLRKDVIYLKMAEVWSERSHCQRHKVGCLIVKDKSIISDGYNGSPHGFPNVCEDEENKTLPYVLHAEANAITKLAKSTLSSVDSTMYVTLSPCYECSKLIIQSGVKRLVIKELYRKLDSLPFLLQAGVEITRIGIIDPTI
jgi:dCMP deaminase